MKRQATNGFPQLQIRPRHVPDTYLIVDIVTPNRKVKVMVARGKKGGKGQAKECTYADFEKALKVGETLTFDATNGVLTGVKITGPANRTRAKKRVGVRSV